MQPGSWNPDHLTEYDQPSAMLMTHTNIFRKTISMYIDITDDINIHEGPTQTTSVSTTNQAQCVQTLMIHIDMCNDTIMLRYHTDMAQ